MCFSKFQNLQRKREQIQDAYNAADKKDVQLQADMKQLNTNRKKWKEQLAVERKKLQQFESVPEKNQAVRF